MGNSKAVSMPLGMPSREIQQMWVSIMGAHWSSLVVVPADANVSLKAVMRALVDIAQIHDLVPFRVVDAGGATVADGTRFAQEVASAVGSGMRAVVVIDSPLVSLGGVPLIRDADVALLVLRLGSSDFDSVRSTMEIVGRERILGSVALPAE